MEKARSRSRSRSIEHLHLPRHLRVHETGSVIAIETDCIPVMNGMNLGIGSGCHAVQRGLQRGARERERGAGGGRECSAKDST